MGPVCVHKTGRAEPGKRFLHRSRSLDSVDTMSHDEWINEGFSPDQTNLLLAVLVGLWSRDNSHVFQQKGTRIVSRCQLFAVHDMHFARKTTHERESHDLKEDRHGSIEKNRRAINRFTHLHLDTLHVDTVSIVAREMRCPRTWSHSEGKGSAEA